MSSEAYHDLLERGAFPDQIDPWAEEPPYFQQLHSSMIQQIVNQIRRPLGDRGYFVAKETSLQILEGGEPHISIQRIKHTPPAQEWDFEGIGTAALMAETGAEIAVTDLERISIRQQASGDLVTVVEVVSPDNKRQDDMIAEYQARRRELVYSQLVNVVEIDVTRSVKRLFNHEDVSLYPYHIMIYLAGRNPRVVGCRLGERLKRFVLPLLREGIAVEPQLAYEKSSRETGIAQQIDIEGWYTLDNLKFPCLISAAERQMLMRSLDKWRAQLGTLKVTS